MQRRDFIKVICGSAVAWPFAAGAQQTDQIRLIGVLMTSAEDDREYQSFLTTFLEELRKLGWFEGRNVRTELGSARQGVDETVC